MPRSTVSTISGLSSISLREIQSIAAAQAKKAVNARGEKKWFPLDINNVPTASSSSFTDLTGQIVQGDQYNQRNGDQIRLTKIICNYQGVINPSASWTGVRILLVRSKGGTQTQSSILLPHGSGIAMYGAVNTAKVDVLHDERSVLDTYGGRFSQNVKFEINLGGSLVQYSPGTNQANKPLYLLIMSDATTLSPSNQGFLVIKYQDM